MPGIPVIIEKGLLDAWPAMQSWKMAQLLQRHRRQPQHAQRQQQRSSSTHAAEGGGVVLKVKRGLADGLPNLYAFVHAEPKEKPASSTVERGDAEWPWFEAPADTSFGDGKTDAALKYRWGGFMASMAERYGAGWTFAAKESVIISSDGESRLTVVPPPRPGEEAAATAAALASGKEAGAERKAAEHTIAKNAGGAKSTEGTAKSQSEFKEQGDGTKDDILDPEVTKMSIPDYIETVMAPEHAENSTNAFNISHPDLRYVFNTMQNSPLHADFTVPDLFEGISTIGQYAGSFDDGHPPGVFEFFFGPALSGAGMHAHYAAW